MLFRKFSNVSRLSLPRISQVYSNFRNFHAICNNGQDNLPVVYSTLIQRRLSKGKDKPLTPDARLNGTIPAPEVEKFNTDSPTDPKSKYSFKKRNRPKKKKERIRRHVIEDKNPKKKKSNVVPLKTRKSKGCVDRSKEVEQLKCPALHAEMKEIDTKDLEILILKSLSRKTDLPKTEVKLTCPVHHPEVPEIDTKALESLILKSLTSNKYLPKEEVKLKCPLQQTVVEGFDSQLPESFQIEKLFQKKDRLENEVDIKCLLVKAVDKRDSLESIIPKDYFTKIDRPKTSKMEITCPVGLSQAPISKDGNKEKDHPKKINMEIKVPMSESGYKETDRPRENKAKITCSVPCPVAEMFNTDSPKLPASKECVKQKDRPKESNIRMKYPITEFKDLFESPISGDNKQTDHPKESKTKIRCSVPCKVAELFDKKSSKDCAKESDRPKESNIKMKYPITEIKNLFETPKSKGDSKQPDRLTESKTKIRCLVPCAIAEMFDTKSPKSPTLKDCAKQNDQPNESNAVAKNKNLCKAPMSEDDNRSKTEIKCKTESTKTEIDNKKSRGENESNNTKKNGNTG